MRVLQVVAAVLAIASVALALHTALTQGDTVFAGRRPSNLGVTDGHLAAARRTPNCVSSQTDPADAEHYVAPIKFSGSASDAMTRLRGIVEGSERAAIVKQEPAYLYAEYRSKLLGFVDDVEFLASGPEGVIHVRSASRRGRRDFGVNRARVESIRARFSALQPGRAKP